MKKILIVEGLRKLFSSDNTFLKRSEYRIFTATTNDDILKVHIKEKLDLIVTSLNIPGAMTSEELFNIISRSRSLQDVRSIIVCDDSRMGRVRCTQCDTDVVLTSPVEVDVLQRKMQELIEESPRQAYRAQLRAALEGKHEERPIRGFTVNISVTGMLIETEKEFEQGSPVLLSFALPDGKVVAVKAEVVRTFKHQTSPHLWKSGVKFTDIAESTLTAIESFSKSRI